MSTHFGLSSCAFALTLALMPSGPAGACSPPPPPEPFRADPDGWPGDVTPPAAVTRVSVDAYPSADDSGCDDCGGRRAGLRLYVEPPEDDRAPAAALGYRLTVIEGAIQDPYPMLTSDFHDPAPGPEGAVIAFTWDDADGTRGLDVVLRIQAIDPAGNVGPPLDLPIRTSGSGSGCSATRGRSAPATALMAAALLVGLARARRRRSGGPK